MQSTVFLVNQGHRNMNVDGSQTPVVFSYAPTVALTQVVSIGCVLVAPGPTALCDFHRSLGRGLLLQGGHCWKETILSKLDLVASFNADHSEPLHAGNFMGTRVISPHSPLILKPGDFLSATIQDDLSSIGVLAIN